MVVWGAWFNQTPDRRSRKLEWGSYFSRSSWKGSRNALTSCTLRALEEERRHVQARIQQTRKMTAAAILNLLWKDEMDKQFQCFIWLQSTTRETSQKTFNYQYAFMWSSSQHGIKIDPVYFTNACCWSYCKIFINACYSKRNGLFRN